MDLEEPAQGIVHLPLKMIMANLNDSSIPLIERATRYSPRKLGVDVIL